MSEIILEENVKGNVIREKNYISEFNVHIKVDQNNTLNAVHIFPSDCIIYCP